MNMPTKPRVDDAQERELSLFPPNLQELVRAELAAGNSIVEIGHSYPAPPAGAYVMLAKQVTTRPRESGDGLKFRQLNGSHYCGEFADNMRHFFVIEPPCGDDSYPDMDAIRAQFAGVPFSPNLEALEAERSALERFDKSRLMTYDSWREGTGYDIEALLSLSESARSSIELSLIPPSDWRDIEALVALKTPRGEAALKETLQSRNVELRLAVMRRAPHLVDEATRLESLMMALETAVPYGGLSATLDLAEEFHPPPVVELLFRGLLQRTGDVAYHFATVLAVIHGKLTSRWDWSLRPRILAFNTTDMAERGQAFLMLYDLLKDTKSFNYQAVDAMAEGLRNAQHSPESPR